jgi:hypothetical protein
MAERPPRSTTSTGGSRIVSGATPSSGSGCSALTPGPDPPPNRLRRNGPMELLASKGMMVATAPGTLETAWAMSSAVRSCSIRPRNAPYERRGNSMVTWVEAASEISRWVSSRAARGSRRSGQSTSSSDRLRPGWASHALRSSAAWLESMTKCTTCNSLGRRVWAYRMARITARSTASTSTTTQLRAVRITGSADGTASSRVASRS